MSITILQQDNMNIIIGKTEALVEGKCDGVNPPESTTTEDIRLFVNLQVNGKLKQLNQNIRLKNGKIANWDIVHTLIDTLNQLGYETMGFYDKLEKGIDKL